MKNLRNVISICSVLFSVTANAAPEPVTVSVTTGKLGHEISPTSIGVSYEIRLLEPADSDLAYFPDGDLAYFRPDNKPLITMFKTLGIKSLRLGGSTLDHTRKPAPNVDKIASCFEFARAAGAKVIYSFRLKDLTNETEDPVQAKLNIDHATKVAKFIRAEYSDVLDSFAMGNEPLNPNSAWSRGIG